jgi:outer membrane lipoprotein-sorting protein
MKHLIWVLVALPALACAQTEWTAYQIANRAQEAIRVKGVMAVSIMRIVDEKGRERVRRIKQVTKLYDNGETEKRLIRFLAPADVKGVGLLTYDYKDQDDDLWLYMPALRKTRRIVSSEKSKNFMGSEFTYADMTPPALNDFTFNKLAEETVNGVLCYTIEWLPNDEEIAEENGFSRRIAYVGREDFVIRKSVYYDLDGELHKELTVHAIKELDTVNHKYRAVKLEMVNLQNNRKSYLENESLEFNSDIDDDYFTTRYLERE